MKETDPFFNGHKASELREDGELFAQLDYEGLQLCFLALEKPTSKHTEQRMKSSESREMFYFSPHVELHWSPGFHLQNP